jgi:hypothetical protein
MDLQAKGLLPPGVILDGSGQTQPKLSPPRP